VAVEPAIVWRYCSDCPCELAGMQVGWL